MRSSFASFSKYAQTLRQLASAGSKDDLALWSDRCQAALNGQPSEELRSLVALKTRRAHGTFFTGSVLAQRLVRHVDWSDSRKQIFLDPTCGVGDLLLAAAHHLALKQDLSGTVRFWGEVLHGLEQEASFVSATKARLTLLARQRLGITQPQSPEWGRVFPFIRQGDAIQAVRPYTTATRILLNPPFGLTPAPAECSWGAGQINAAAIFLSHAIDSVRTGTQVFAILPEVLRTGARYQKWREVVGRKTEVIRVEPYGIFDDSADVHVFLLVLRKRSRPTVTGLFDSEPRKSKQTVEDLFDVCVGAVVPYRDPHSGPVRRYVHPRNVPAWSKVSRVNETRRFEGSVVKPPFVVIRRTSRPGDTYRATSAILLGVGAVAVENHLVVCKPRDGRESTCERLMSELKSDKVNRFLDAKMRCRHLTVGIVKQIPIHFPETPVTSLKREH